MSDSEDIDAVEENLDAAINSAIDAREDSNTLIPNDDTEVPSSEQCSKVDSDKLLCQNVNEDDDIGQNNPFTEDVAVDPSPSKLKACCKTLQSARAQVYASQFLSSWGDRMWMFAGGLFLLEVTPGSLRLAAVYGAGLAFTVIICGAPIGRLVDRTSRLAAAQISLCIQNIMVCVCAAILVVMTTRRHLFTAWDGWALVVAEGFVILTACIAQLGTLGTKLTIEKDWILVICGQDRTKLAGMNSVLRSLDLSTEVLAPVIVGAVMSSFGMAAGGIVIACWNVGSLVVEYGLLHHLYYSSEDLQKPKVFNDDNYEKEDSKGGIKTLAKLKEKLVSAWGAWVAYMKHPVRDAGLGLSLLYMTVLAFDNYSRAFVFESGVTETVLGILTAVASLFGILGAVVYPKLRAKIGIVRTGLFGFGAETMCLTLCVASVFAPGSPFDANALISKSGSSSKMGIIYNTTIPAGFVNDSLILDKNNITSQITLNLKSEDSDNDPYKAESSWIGDIVYNATVPDSLFVNSSILDEESSLDQNTVKFRSNDSSICEENDYTFVILLLAGIITSRTGLWLADLSVTQILQEGVDESERGAINGVQSSLNQSLDLLRSILLIILPTRATFGFLIMLSFIFVTVGWMLYGVYARKHMSRSGTYTVEENNPKPVNV
ncbi:hypothetical protein SK128_003748 [Halocaridina rubra]|uniref:Solute carrier family 40 member n=1 Tax=Halocaridina rubra TaxID=373956 RepID=A0AAN8WQN5_HALRR